MSPEKSGRYAPARQAPPRLAPARRDLLQVEAAARLPDGAEVVGVGVAPGARSVRCPGGRSVAMAHLQRRGFEAKAGQVVALPVQDGERSFLAVGLGGEDEGPASERVRLAAAALVRSAGRTPWVALVPGSLPSGLAPAEAAQAVAEGAALAAYRYGGFKSSASAGGRVERLTLVAPGPREMQRHLDRGAVVASAVALVRDLVNEPGAALTPIRFAEVAEAVAVERGLEVTVYDSEAIAAEGLGGLAGVARGSDQEARLVRLEYDPGHPGAPTVALVGKGITFDSGGLSLKSYEGMLTMKDDMAGAAVVLAVMSLLRELDVPVRVLGFAPLTENMPGGRAIKPGDVLRARNGKTIEVLNTDAEGRLVLADGLSLAAEERPDAIIDLATLTGAVVTALGKGIAGLMGNDPGLLARVEEAARRSAERVWPLPLPRDYRRDIDSDVADVKNVGRASQAGSIVAGLFLEEFVSGVPWAHLDIAGTAFVDVESGYTSKGATGYGVRLLVELLSRWATRSVEG